MCIRSACTGERTSRSETVVYEGMVSARVLGRCDIITLARLWDEQPYDCKKIWCQRRHSNSQTPVSKTGCHSNSHTLARLVHRGGFEPLRPTRGNRVTAGLFQPGSRACANLAKDRRIERPSLITMPRFSGPTADHSAVPSAWRRVRELNTLASLASALV